ncbi:polysaccharide pyruvyl transferase family protein [Microbacterium sp. NPDC090225]|uniref:polysaccharide pyruvyl transferase family protein n=1 Tax=Microbacterium sp. NPDC090225 TaxID=3364207 RepID=UPI00381D9CF2
MPPHTLPLVVACGAYERDNLGDLLFLVVADHFAREVVDVEYTAPIAVDMTALLGRQITATGTTLTEKATTGIWTVGGEVGSTQREYVYRTAVDDDEWERFSSLDASEQDVLLDEVMNARMESPYVPRPSAFPRNRAARLVLNSVGVSGIGGLTPWRAAVATSALREAHYISVRDPKSSALLDRLGIPHRLAPDLVHTIASVLPIDAPRNRAVLIQLSEGHIRTYGIEAWTSAIVGCSELGDRPLRLFVAGSAPAHDSIELYRELIDRVSTERPDWDIALSDARSIDDRVREIATASLWIGSSLHGRILACAYGTKRLSIAKPKVDVYAETWDADFPFGIEPSTLPAAVTAALEREPDAAHAATLADSARTSVVDALAVFTDADNASENDALAIRIDEVAQLQIAAMRLEHEHAEAVRSGKERAAEALRLAGDRDEQRRARRAAQTELAQARARLHEIETSTSWKIGSRLTSAARALRLPRPSWLRRRGHDDDPAAH